LIFRKFHILLLLAVLSSSLAFSQRDKKKKNTINLAPALEAEAERNFTEGEKYFILEDYTKALDYFQRALGYSPRNGTIYYKIAEVLAKSEKPEDLDRAAANIEDALRYNDRNKYYYLLASNIYARQHELPKAIQILEKMVKEIGGTHEYYYDLASLYLQSNNLDGALTAYNKAEEFMGVNEISSSQKQRIYLNKGKVQEAIREGEKLISAFPSEQRYAMAQAELLNQHGMTAGAISLLENFIKENPESGSVKVLLAGLYRDAGQEEKSRTFVNQLFDDPEVEVGSKILMLGTYNSMLSQTKSRKINNPELETFVNALFQKLVSQYPAEADVHLMGGDMFMMLEKTNEAMNEYRKALRSGTASAEAWQNLLYLETQANLPDSVILHAEQATELFPNHAIIYYFNGIAQMKRKHYREAASVFEQAKKLAGSNTNLLSEVNSLLGDAYNGTKEYDKSDKAYEDALAINPSNDIVLNNYSYYLALRKTNLEKAERMSSQLIKNNPNNATYLDTHAWVLYQAGKYKEAKKTMEKAIGSGQATATHFEHYGDILFQLGQTDEAVAQWIKAKSLNGNNEVLNKKITDRKIH
jgi:tetratricopeptide (TPR) repeat protein